MLQKIHIYNHIITIFKHLSNIHMNLQFFVLKYYVLLIKTKLRAITIKSKSLYYFLIFIVIVYIRRKKSIECH